MKTGIRITILVDNVASRSDMLTEHGLSLWIECGTKHILWDTGQSDILPANAKLLGVDLAQTDIIALSHGHYDHTGGLAAITHSAPKAEMYIHPDALTERYSKKESVRPVGIPDAAIRVLKSGKTHWITTWTQISDGVYLTGSIPRQNSIEDTGGAFYLDLDCRIPDRLPDDQALVLESPNGLIVILGCAHSGTVNTLDYISRKTGQSQIYAVIGGMHLGKASKQRLDYTIEAIRRYSIQKVIPLHCTGQNATSYLRNILSDKLVHPPLSPCLELEWK